MDFNSEFLKDRYDYELDRKDKLTAALALPVGVLGLLGSAGVAMVRTFTFRDPTLSVLFVLFTAVGFLTFTACLILLCWAFVAQTYVYLPLLEHYAAGIIFVADQLRFAMPKQEIPTPAPTTTTPQAFVPERPTFPPNRVIKEGREPGRNETTVEKK